MRKVVLIGVTDGKDTIIAGGYDVAKIKEQYKKIKIKARTEKKYEYDEVYYFDSYTSKIVDKSKNILKHKPAKEKPIKESDLKNTQNQDLISIAERFNIKAPALNLLRSDNKINLDVADGYDKKGNEIKGNAKNKAITAREKLVKEICKVSAGAEPENPIIKPEEKGKEDK